MFSNCENFNQDLNDWDINGKDINNMFHNCKNLNQEFTLNK